MVVTCNSSQTNRLLQRPLDRDQQALADLFGRHRERLRKMIRLRLDRRLRARFDSTTVLQQVFPEVQRRIGEYQGGPPGSFFLWLRQVTARHIADLHRQYLGVEAATAGQEILLTRGALPGVTPAALAAQGRGDRPAVGRADLMLRLQEALNGLAPGDREVLALCHFEDLTEEETAAVLGIDRAVASLQYLRALKRLKEILNAIPGFFDRPSPGGRS
jgi:RNA polymerase sigma-70 factor (ECF subfamily)